MIVGVQYRSDNYFQCGFRHEFLGFFEDEDELRNHVEKVFHLLGPKPDVWVAEVRVGLRTPDLDDLADYAFTEEEASSKEWHKLKMGGGEVAATS